MKPAGVAEVERAKKDGQLGRGLRLSQPDGRACRFPSRPGQEHSGGQLLRNARQTEHIRRSSLGFTRRRRLILGTTHSAVR